MQRELGARVVKKYSDKNLFLHTFDYWARCARHCVGDSETIKTQSLALKRSHRNLGNYTDYYLSHRIKQLALEGTSDTFVTCVIKASQASEIRSWAPCTQATGPAEAGGGGVWQEFYFIEQDSATKFHRYKELEGEAKLENRISNTNHPHI